jgi:hypothetical protein
MLKEGEPQGSYSLIKADTPRDFSKKVIVDSISKGLRFSSTDNLSVIDVYSALFRVVKTEIPVYPDDEYQYLRYLPQGKGLYEIRSTVNNVSGKMLTKNFYDYAVFAKEGESILRAGSYLPADFYLWLDTARGPGSNRFRTSVFIIKDAIDTAQFNVQGYFLHVNDSSRFNSDEYSVSVGGKRYSRGNFVHAKRTASNALQLLDAPISVGEDSIGEYRFYLQKTEEEGKYYLVTEKGYGGYRDSTGYLSYLRVNADKNEYFFGPREAREGANKLIVELKRSNGPVANGVIPKPAVPEVTQKEITATGGTGSVLVQNAAGYRVQVYNIVGQIIADKIAGSDSEQIPVSRGISIVKIGQSVTKKVVVR